jgi:hypothetical protein
MKSAAAVPLMAAFVAGCGSAAPTTPLTSPPLLRTLDAPAAEGAGEPHLALLPDGRALLSWVETAAGGHALRLATRHPGGDWSTPVSVAEGSGWFVNWADVPSVGATPDGTLFAHWLTKSGPGTYAYDVRVSISRDGGESWGDPFVLHRDGTRSEHGFVSMLPRGDDRMGFVWLDGRDTVDASGARRQHGADGAEMKLFFTTLTATGERGDEVSLDGRVCDCCQTAADSSGELALVAYRDRSPDEVRDISVVRLAAGAWTPPATVARDGWRIEGCPVNGPALDADSSKRAAIAWFSAPQQAAAVQVAFSSDGGASWGDGIRVDEGRPLGRVDVALLGPDSALVTWLEQSQSGAELRLRQVASDGRLSESRLVSQVQAARASGFPRLLVAGAELLVAWRDAGDPPRLRTAVARLP